MAQSMSEDDASALASIRPTRSVTHTGWHRSSVRSASRRRRLELGMAHELDNSHPDERYPGFESAAEMNNNITGASVGEWVRSEKAAYRIGANACRRVICLRRIHHLGLRRSWYGRRGGGPAVATDSAAARRSGRPRSRSAVGRWPGVPRAGARPSSGPLAGWGGIWPSSCTSATCFALVKCPMRGLDRLKSTACGGLSCRTVSADKSI